MDNFLNLVTTQGEAIFGSLWPLVWALVRIVIIVLPMFGAVAYMTLWERKLIGWMHIRLGPNRVGPLGLLQPIADALKLLMKEIIWAEARIAPRNGYLELDDQPAKITP